MRVANQNTHIQKARPASEAPPLVSCQPPPSVSPQAPPEGKQLSDAEKLMNELRNTYKNIHFDFISLSDTGQIQNYAASKKGLNNVALSPQLLEKMANDEGLKNRVKNILSLMNNYQFSSHVQAGLMDKKLTGMGLILDENGEVSKWTAMEDQKKDDFSWAYQKKDGNESPFFKKTTKKQSPFAVSYKYSHSQSMMRLASAKNVPSVRGLIAQKQSEISKVKLQVSDPVEAAAIIRKIKSLIQSGNIKIARLHKEERIYQQKRAAAKKMKFKQEQRLAEELRKKRTARKAQEHCQTASFDDIFVKPSVDDYRYRQVVEAYADTMSGYTGAASGVPSASADPTVSAVQITVTPIVSVDCSA